MARPRTDARERLLSQVIDHVTEHGVAGLSLRELAAAIGTSHRMLVYHFGSKDQLLAEVVRSVEAGQRAQVEALAQQLALGADGTAAPDVAQHIRSMWTHLVAPATQRQERLFFAMVGMALQGDPTMRPLIDDLVTPWLAPVTEIRRRQGASHDDAAADARLALAVTRGLLLDLLATGDLEATTRAFERFGVLLGTDRTRPSSARVRRTPHREDDRIDPSPPVATPPVADA